jgi:Zn-dependent protease with chaperone function
MAMDFFDHQERARRKTGRLVLMFIVAVVGIIVLAYLAVAIGFMFLNQPKSGQSMGPAPTLWNPMLLLAVGVAVVAIVGCGSLFKISQLAGGGRVVAESLGGRLLDTGSTDPGERKLLNVVEEMAIASGVPVPKVYLMDNEQAINAFAAGFGPDDAVIGVTRGCVDLLDRDELQGVIAHEFSHILNGDMRLNIRLIGILFGILVIGLIGRMVLSSMRYSGGGRSRSNSKNGGGAILVILGVALALMVIGYLGFFFGGLIKSAVSRQREFLADASAVQFTRYPGGIGGALKKIGGYSFGSRVLNPRAEEVSHMFFGQGVSNALGGLGATHPPLDQRISRIEPGWDGVFPEVRQPRHVSEKQLKKQAKLSRGEARRKAIGALTAMGAGAVLGQAEGATAVLQVGQPTDAHVQRARDLLNAIPAEVKDATHSSLGACAVIYAMLLSDEPEVHTRQTEAIREAVDAPAAAESVKLGDAIQGMDPSARLPLLDMAMPALHNLAPGQYQAFKGCVSTLIAADQRIDLFEWMLGRVLLRRLAPAFEPGKRTRQRVRYYSLKPVRDHLATLLSTLARHGHADHESAKHAFDQAMEHLPLSPTPGLTEPDACGLRQIGEALTKLNTVGPREKKAVINACAVCITADKQVTPAEAELLRAVCDSLDCPMPPLLPGQALI